MVERLLKVEHTDEPTEIVIHVNMLKEGWDVTNLYTIVPLIVEILNPDRAIYWTWFTFALWNAYRCRNCRSPKYRRP